MLVAERFIASLVNTYGKHLVSTDGGTLSSSLQILESRSSYPFLCRKKFDRKDNAVCKR